MCIVVVQGSASESFKFQVVYQGAQPIEDGRVVLFFGPVSDPEPRLEAADLDKPLPLFGKDVVCTLHDTALPPRIGY